MNNPVLIILFGPPGSGKGTQANLISEDYGIEFLDAGNEFRNFALIHVEDPTSEDAERSLRVHKYLNLGKPILTDDYLYIIKQKVVLQLDEGKSLIMDKPGGVLLPEAEWMSKLIDEMELRTLFFHLHVSEKMAIKRISNRYYVPGQKKPYKSYDEAIQRCIGNVKPVQREDDLSKDLVKNRYQTVYSNNKEGIMRIFEANKNVQIFDIDAEMNIEEVDEAVSQILDKTISKKAIS